MSGLELTLGLAALLIGATGTFSPCGFSVVETLGPTGHTGGRKVTIAACLAFLPGAVAGAVLTFGSLAALGGLAHGAGGRAAYLAAAAIAVVAAVLELRGTHIVPQIRRQLPEHWRRVMPMPVAGAREPKNQRAASAPISASSSSRLTNSPARLLMPTS